MIGNVLSLLALVAVALFFGWLVTRAWRAKRAIVKWPGVILAGLLTLILVLVSGIVANGLIKMYTPHNFAVSSITVAGTPEQIERGKHIASITCTACHSSNNELPLSGGKNLSEDTGLPLGNLYPPNLTPAGELRGWSDGEILRAIREGVHKSGRPLMVMPAQNLRNLSDEDAHSVVAYLRSQPAVQHETPPMNPSLLAVILTGAGIVEFDLKPVTGPVAAPAKGPTAEYGQYIVSFQDCRDCHGKDFTGGKPPAPVGPDLHLIKGWTQEQFIQTIRTGVDPSGHQLKPTMPWQTYARMDDIELAATYEYMRNLPPVAATRK
jgi:mono/diheme cytochrome c family protein